MTLLLRCALAATALAAALLGCKTLGLTSDNEVKPKPPVAAEAGTPSKPAWQVDVGASDRLARLSPAVVDDAIYVASSAGNVISLDFDGRTLWQIKVKFSILGGVGADDKLVVVGGKKGELAAFDAQSGKALWQAGMPSEVVTAPVVTPEVIVVRTLDGRIFGVNRADGKRKWVYQRILPALILRNSAPMTLADNYVFIGYPGGKLIALQHEKGALVLEESVSTPRGGNELERLTDISSRPIVSGHEVYAAAYQGRVGAFNLRTGDPIWFRNLSSAAGLDVDARMVYVASDAGLLHALDRDIGTEKWQVEVLAGARLVQPVVAGDVVVVGDAFGFLHFFSTADGKEMGRIRLDGAALTSPPVLLPDGSILVQTMGGKLTRLKP